MNKLKAIVYFMLASCALGTAFTRGAVEGVFEQMLVLLVIFILVVELVPQFIVDERKQPQEVQ